VRTPVHEDALGLLDAAGGPHGEEAVIQRELDEIDDEWELVQNKCPP
jgi:hypothetical protein